MGRKKRPGANTAEAEAGSWWRVQDPSLCWGRRGQTANTGIEECTPEVPEESASPYTELGNYHWFLP